MSYEERVVCFIDILGFKAHIDKSTQDVNYIKTISMVLDAIADVTNMEEDDAKDRNIDVKVTQFSDNIVLSYKIDSDDQLAFIIISISDMISRLIQYGFLLRGAITQGKVIHTDKQLFGPAMNEAYELESKVAIYPRIIISRDVLFNANFSEKYEENAKNRIMDWCKTDGDGWHYIDYIGSERYSTLTNHLEHLRRINTIIEDNKFIQYSVKQKMGWLNRKLDKELHWIKENHKKQFNCCDQQQFDFLRKKARGHAKILYSQTTLRID